METIIHIVGQKIHQRRRGSQLTLEEMAERVGCTAGFLSQVERNQAVPSISMLYSIAKALGVEVTYFFPRVTPGAKVVRANERERIRFEGSYLIYSPLSTSLPERELEALVVQIAWANGTPLADEYRAHPGEEFAYVLEGTLRLRIGDAIYDLDPGDSVHFKSTVKHRIENLGNKPAVAFWALTPPVF